MSVKEHQTSLLQSVQFLELMEVRDIVQEAVIQTIPKKKKVQKGKMAF